MVSSMKKEIKKYTSPEEIVQKGFCTIRKVPHHICEADRNSYEPIVAFNWSVLVLPRYTGPTTHGEGKMEKFRFHTETEL